MCFAGFRSKHQNVGEVLFFKRNAAGLHAAGRVLQLVLARAVAAPHGLDEAGLAAMSRNSSYVVAMKVFSSGSSAHAHKDRHAQPAVPFSISSSKGYQAETKIFSLSCRGGRAHWILLNILRTDLQTQGTLSISYWLNLQPGSCWCRPASRGTSSSGIHTRVCLVEHAGLMLCNRDDCQLDRRPSAAAYKTVVVAVYHDDRR